MAESRHKEDLLAAHRDLYIAFAVDLSELTPAVFFAPQGEHWSPAEHCDHLIRSVDPMVRAMRWPRFLLRLLFGEAEGSRPADEVLALYRQKLAAGAGARGRYRPKIDDDRTEGRQRRMVTECSWLGEKLGRVLFRWPDRQLDRFRLPHPLLGRLTLREMLAWSLEHGRIHHRRVLERLEPEAGPESGAAPSS